MASFTHSRIKIVRYFQKCWRLENLQKYRSNCVTDGKPPKICLSWHRKKYRKISAILYNWKTADRIEAGFSLNKRISLTDTTHEAITVSEISDFNLCHLDFCEKLFSVHFLNLQVFSNWCFIRFILTKILRYFQKVVLKICLHLGLGIGLRGE